MGQPKDKNIENEVVLIHFFHSEGWHKGIELAFSIFIW